jgi:Asp-tRNA(Asn)/Glu-tRNA(Gln) amidotransferase A subunit family amidase
MSSDLTPEDLLEQTHAELNAMDYDPAEHGGMDRRQFVFFSLVSAAATTFGAAGAAAQPPTGGRGGGGRGGAVPGAQPPAVAMAVPALGNGEAPAEQFMPYPGGTGALMVKLVKEHGPAAFTRSAFTVQPWTGAVPTDPTEIAFLPAHRLSALLKARRITSAKLTDIYLERLERLNPTLRCAVTIMADSARAEAKKADAEIAAGRYRGPLHGIPYGVKDLFNTKNAPTTWGSPDFKDQVIDQDAEVVVRLREAGAVLIAKLSTGIFAQNDQWYGGRTNNPWNLTMGASGSSAGPGSATAAGCVAFGIGTETQGSITSPSTRNGLSALRPTFGRVSRAGGMVLSWTQDRVGPMCRTIEDCAMVFNAIHGVDEKDPSTVTTPFTFDRSIRMATVRIGYDKDAPKEFIDGFRALGAQMKEVAPRPALQAYGMGGGGLNAEYAAAFDFFVQRKAKEVGLDLANLPAPTPRKTDGTGGGGVYGTMPEDYTSSPMAPANWNPRFVGGRTIRAYEYINVQRRRLQYAAAYQQAFKDVDMIVSTRGDVGENAQTGNPCVVVPYKFDVPTGFGGGAGNAQQQAALKPQPICGIIVGALYADDKLLSAAHQFQLRTDAYKKHPTL